jgi:CO/xanthine dehydrogenase Mo-binding subunit
MDAKQKLQEIAAKTLGGNPESYQVAGERVFSGGRSMTLAQAAQKAIELGGKYDGHEAPENVNRITKQSTQALAGQGLIGVGRDTYPHDGATNSYVVGFAEVEVDVETGHYQVLDYLAVGDVGTVLHPRALGGQLLGGSLQGMGHAMSQKWVYDQHYGVTLAKRMYLNKPASILDAPARMQWDAVGIPDPETPVGVRGVGEPPVGAGFGAVLNALVDAIGSNVFRRYPVTADMILTALEAGKPTHERLTANI